MVFLLIYERLKKGKLVMKLDAVIVYEEEYLPSNKHRIPRKREVQEVVQAELKEKKRDAFSLALTIHDYQSYLGEDGESQFGIVETEYLTDKENLYIEKREQSGALILEKSTVEDLRHSINRELSYMGKQFNTRERARQFLEEKLNQYVMIDGVIYERTSEPRYAIITFGLGHNHGGTNYFIENFYNPNISKDNYFNALEFDKMKERAIEIANSRGDTKDISRIQESRVKIEVHDPSVIKCNPQKEHGFGDPFLNSLEDVIQGSPDILTAGLGVMAKTAGIIKDENMMEMADSLGANERKVLETFAESMEILNDENLQNGLQIEEDYEMD